MSEYFLRFDPAEIKGNMTMKFLDSLVDGIFLEQEEFEEITSYLDGDYDYQEYITIFKDFTTLDQYERIKQKFNII